MNKPRLIISLCDASGVWSDPYRAAGYEVIQVDVALGRDVRTFNAPRQPHGVLAAPPCTHFTNAASAQWPKIPRQEFLLSLEIAAHCFRICRSAAAWWCLENPRGRLGKYFEEHCFEFQPHWYGDRWSKRTCLWGTFNLPAARRVIPTHALVGGHRRQEPTAGLFGRVQLPAAELIKSPGRFADATPEWHAARQAARSVTPPGFARAFYEANP